MKYRQAKTGRLLIEIIPNKCDFCGCCVGICPEDAIELKEAEIFIIDFRCTNCAKCIWSCPIEVIKFNRKGVIARQVIQQYVINEFLNAVVKKEYDVIVVGAGPAGSMAARFAAEQGVSVLMLEKDRDVGYPVRCGEAISKKGVENFIEPDERWITAHITKFSLNAPDGNEALIEFDDSGYVLERKIFDYELAKTAVNAGADILTRAYVNGLIIEEDRVAGVKYEFQGEPKEIKSKIVIGADGVESRVGRWAGIETYVDFRNMECCTQITASNIPLDQNTLYFYFGKDYAPGGYFWIFPKGKNIANIGLGS